MKQMKKCTFCSEESQMLFTNLTRDMGLLCVKCYMLLDGSCAGCGGGFIPSEMKEDVTYEIKAKFISMGEKKSIMVCDCCCDFIKQALPEQMG
jgi:hypothetical protein